MRSGVRPANGPFIPLSEITLRTSRSSGPGGQHANVTASRVEAVFAVEDSVALTGSQKGRIVRRLGPVVTAVAQDARSQARNRDLALERLEARLSEALKTAKPRRPTKPTRASRNKRLKGKKTRSEVKKNRRRPGLEDA